MRLSVSGHRWPQQTVGLCLEKVGLPRRRAGRWLGREWLLVRSRSRG